MDAPLADVTVPLMLELAPPRGAVFCFDETRLLLPPFGWGPVTGLAPPVEVKPPAALPPTAELPGSVPPTPAAESPFSFPPQPTERDNPSMAHQVRAVKSNDFILPARPSTPTAARAPIIRVHTTDLLGTHSRLRVGFIADERRVRSGGGPRPLAECRGRTER